VAGVADKLFAGFQRVLPTRWLGKLVYRLSRSQRPRLKNALIRLFVRMYRVDTTEMDRDDPCDYRSFNDFFSRALRPGARAIDPDPRSVCSPADGAVQQIGQVKDGQLLQVKGIEYGLADLLGVPAADLRGFESGAFLTIYLAPHNYHRVHMPGDASIGGTIYIPGKRLAVNQATARAVPGLFTGNERLACDCRGPDGHFWLVFVGAMNVSSISTAWAGEVLPWPNRVHTAQRRDFAPAPLLEKGDYCGHFNMGSTVVLIYPDATVAWDPSLGAGSPLRVGQKVGSIRA
jgi:phosphatidylserine decarboxylase